MAGCGRMVRQTNGESRAIVVGATAARRWTFAAQSSARCAVAHQGRCAISTGGGGRLMMLFGLDAEWGTSSVARRGLSSACVRYRAKRGSRPRESGSGCCGVAVVDPGRRAQAQSPAPSTSIRRLVIPSRMRRKRGVLLGSVKRRRSYSRTTSARWLTLICATIACWRWNGSACRWWLTQSRDGDSMGQVTWRHHVFSADSPWPAPSSWFVPRDFSLDLVVWRLRLSSEVRSAISWDLRACRAATRTRLADRSRRDEPEPSAAARLRGLRQRPRCFRSHRENRILESGARAIPAMHQARSRCGGSTPSRATTSGAGRRHRCAPGTAGFGRPDSLVPCPC